MRRCHLQKRSYFCTVSPEVISTDNPPSFSILVNNRKCVEGQSY
ncbi:MAG: hypothetical protein ACP5KV_02575 [Candidatus Methanomethylicaceae archaeon]